MGAIDEALEANARAAAHFEGGMPRPPKKRLAVVACMDTRVQPYEMLGLRPGDAHIIRNAGGIVTDDVMRSLLISYHIGDTNEWMIVNNTKCGMTQFSDGELRERIERVSGTSAVVPDSFHAFSDVEENVQRQVDKVLAHPWTPQDVTVRGFVYDVDTGLLLEVSPRVPEVGAGPPGRA